MADADRLADGMQDSVYGVGFGPPKRETSMSEFDQQPAVVHTTGTPRWVGLAVVILALLAVAGIGVGWSAINHANSIGR